jgi:hypothetical protein
MSTEHDPPASDPSQRTDDPLVAPREEAAVPGTELESPAAETPAPVAENSGVAAQIPPLYEERPPAHEPSRNMLPGRERRRSRFERLIVRLVATCGVVGIGVAIAAIMVSSKSQGWVVGLVVSIVTVILSGLLWSSRQL